LSKDECKVDNHPSAITHEDKNLLYVANLGLSIKSMFRHAGLDPASRGSESSGFGLEFTPMKIGAGMTIPIDTNYFTLFIF